jgi:hypothetical protein
MPLTLVVQTGDSSGRRFLADGAALRVGRVAPAEVCVLDDPMLSANHFSIEPSEHGYVLRDQKSRFGTQLNGLAVGEAVLQDGDIILAGRTKFVVELVGTQSFARPSVEEPTPMPHSRPAPTAERIEETGGALAFLRGQHNLHAVLDAARDPAILQHLRGSGLVHESLYDGPRGVEIADFGPWLVELPRGTPFLDLLVNDGWGESWGVFLTSHSSFAEIRKQLRRHLLAKLPDGREVYFRYYDPRVLRTYLATCTPPELGGFFGPITNVFVESGDRGFLLVFGPTFKEWRKLPLAAKVPA